MAGMTLNITVHENPYFKNKNNTILRCSETRICPHKAKYSTHIYFYWWFAHDSYSVFIRYQMSQFLCVTRLNTPQPTVKFRLMPYPLKVYYILPCPNRPPQHIFLLVNYSLSGTYSIVSDILHSQLSSLLVLSFGTIRRMLISLTGNPL